MLEIIGLIAWFLFSAWLTAVPVFAVLASSLLGGNNTKGEKIFNSVVFMLALVNWWYFFGSFDISVVFN